MKELFGVRTKLSYKKMIFKKFGSIEMKIMKKIVPFRPMCSCLIDDMILNKNTKGAKKDVIKW